MNGHVSLCLCFVSCPCHFEWGCSVRTNSVCGRTQRVAGGPCAHYRHFEISVGVRGFRATLSPLASFAPEASKPLASVVAWFRPKSKTPQPSPVSHGSSLQTYLSRRWIDNIQPCGHPLKVHCTSLPPGSALTLAEHLPLPGFEPARRRLIWHVGLPKRSAQASHFKNSSQRFVQACRSQATFSHRPNLHRP